MFNKYVGLYVVFRLIVRVINALYELHVLMYFVSIRYLLTLGTILEDILFISKLTKPFIKNLYKFLLK